MLSSGNVACSKRLMQKRFEVKPQHIENFMSEKSIHVTDRDLHDFVPPPAAAHDDSDYLRLLARLNKASLNKRFDAYNDIAWDDPEMQIRRDDPRWELSDHDALGETKWYRSLPQQSRIALALDRTVARMKTGILFESILIRGMMEFLATLPNGSLEFRYGLHECIEEAQHSLMFQEFINRAGGDPEGLNGATRLLARYIISQGRNFPELYFIFVLGGEGPIDYDQREQLKKQNNLHPLMRRIAQIHVTEEARHISFANAYLREHVPKLGAWKRLKLRIHAPLILGNMGKMFLLPPASVIQRYAVPADVIAAAYEQNPAQKRALQAALAPLSMLCRELRILHPLMEPLWRRLSLIA